MRETATRTEITITTDPKFAQTILATFDNYDAAKAHFESQLHKLHIYRGGMVTMTEGSDAFSIFVNEAGGEEHIVS